ncbi:VOC family protein [Elongatibacter sediminis]|uniref:VOC family protein n=1 Tax=Elongatibacter sediminis TaxID=3119006 RepID=A0AAW9RBS9_9GAMM
MNPTHPRTQGAHHIGLTVPDLGAARRFFAEALGFDTVGEVPDYPAAFLSDGEIMITLWQAENPDQATPFDRRANIGLHHLALRAGDAAALARLHDALAVRDDASVEFAPEALGDTGLQHMMVRIPGNIRLELVAA